MPSEADGVREPTVEEIARAIAWNVALDGYQRAARAVQALYAPALRAASTAADEARRGAWQPIETAPRDWTEILVWRLGEGTHIARWMSGGWQVDAVYEVKPTHWQPLPEWPRALATTAGTGQDGTGGGA